jgi:crotonobetainyl-CoA:carnitine CoA-transferase CaiB-like acyl-CoA transferase
LNVTAVQTIEFDVFGKVLSRQGNRGHTAAIQDLYQCAGDDNWIAVSVRTEGERDALAALTGGSFETQEPDAVVEKLATAGIAAAVVVSPSLVTENPQLRHRGFFEPLEHPRTGPGLYPCPPFARLDGTENWLFRAPPTLGQHNIDVLTEMCGVTAAELEQLAAQGVIGTRPKGL